MNSIDRTEGNNEVWCNFQWRNRAHFTNNIILNFTSGTDVTFISINFQMLMVHWRAPNKNSITRYFVSSTRTKIIRKSKILCLFGAVITKNKTFQIKSKTINMLFYRFFTIYSSQCPNSLGWIEFWILFIFFGRSIELIIKFWNMPNILESRSGNNNSLKQIKKKYLIQSI